MSDESSRSAVSGIGIAHLASKGIKNMPAKRELIEPHPGDKRYIRRDDQGRIKESDDLHRSLSQDDRKKAVTATTPGQGDRGDRKPAKAK
jgi:hypothetical protein